MQQIARPEPAARAVAVGRFALGVVALTAVSSMVWLTMWASIVPAIRGWTPVAILSGSMGPAIHAGDVVLAVPPGTDTLGPGSVVVFDNPAGEGRITHRVVAIDPGGGYVTRGDANAAADSTPVSHDAILGVARILVPAIGTPLVWVDNGQWRRLIVGLVVVLASVWSARWAVLPRFAAWKHAGARFRSDGRRRALLGDVARGRRHAGAVPPARARRAPAP